MPLVFTICMGMYGSVVKIGYREYPAESVTDPKGALRGVSRVGRGGSFFTPVDSAKARVSFRGGTDVTPATRGETNGFRLAKTP